MQYAPASDVGAMDAGIMTDAPQDEPEAKLEREGGAGAGETRP